MQELKSPYHPKATAALIPQQQQNNFPSLVAIKIAINAQALKE